MSFFYLSPVKGNIPSHLMETILVQRIEFMKSLLLGDSTIYNEYVIEGSLYDNVGHYMLCVISILGGNTEFTQFILKAEVELFKKRLLSLGAYELRCFAKKLVRSTRKFEFVPYFIEPVHILCQHLLLKNVAQHVCSLHNNVCENYKIKLNFKHCLEYVARREVDIHNGIADLPCGKWKHYFAILFCNNLRHRLRKTDLSPLKSDPRIMELLQKVKQEFFPKSSKHSTTLSSKEVDSKKQLFPPCMLNLHQNLRKKHRLSHFQRFYYSLFLKDIGMPLEEAVYFWRAEYRQSSKDNHICCHNWERDEKKYLYGIRHMYGLEGARKNYTSVSCQRIQSIDNACSEGGCPFKSFDDSYIIPLLQNPSEQLMKQINEFRNKNQYTKSCLTYLNSIVETVDCDKLSFSFTPVKYYSIASKNCV